MIASTDVSTSMMNLEQKFDLIALSADQKRGHLVLQAHRRTTLRRILQFISGLLALVAGGSIAVLVAKLTDSNTLQVISALLAFVSGLISLVMITFLDERDTSKMFEGAGEFLGLREAAELASKTPITNEKKSFEALRSLSESYVQISRQYDRYLSKAMRNKFKSRNTAAVLSVLGDSAGLYQDRVRATPPPETPPPPASRHPSGS